MTRRPSSANTSIANADAVIARVYARIAGDLDVSPDIIRLEAPPPDAMTTNALRCAAAWDREATRLATLNASARDVSALDVLGPLWSLRSA